MSLSYPTYPSFIEAFTKKLHDHFLKVTTFDVSLTLIFELVNELHVSCEPIPNMSIWMYEDGTKTKLVFNALLTIISTNNDAIFVDYAAHCASMLLDYFQKYAENGWQKYSEGYSLVESAFHHPNYNARRVFKQIILYSNKSKSRNQLIAKVLGGDKREVRLALDILIQCDTIPDLNKLVPIVLQKFKKSRSKFCYWRFLKEVFHRFPDTAEPNLNTLIELIENEDFVSPTLGILLEARLPAKPTDSWLNCLDALLRLKTVESLYVFSIILDHNCNIIRYVYRKNIVKKLISICDNDILHEPISRCFRKMVIDLDEISLFIKEYPRHDFIWLRVIADLGNKHGEFGSDVVKFVLCSVNQNHTKLALKALMRIKWSPKRFTEFIPEIFKAIDVFPEECCILLRDVINKAGDLKVHLPNITSTCFAHIEKEYVPGILRQVIQNVGVQSYIPYANETWSVLKPISGNIDRTVIMILLSELDVFKSRSIHYYEEWRRDLVSKGVLGDFEMAAKKLGSTFWAGTVYMLICHSCTSILFDLCFSIPSEMEPYHRSLLDHFLHSAQRGMMKTLDLWSLCFQFGHDNYTINAIFKATLNDADSNVLDVYPFIWKLIDAHGEKAIPSNNMVDLFLKRTYLSLYEFPYCEFVVPVMAKLYNTTSIKLHNNFMQVVRWLISEGEVGRAIKFIYEMLSNLDEFIYSSELLPILVVMLFEKNDKKMIIDTIKLLEKYSDSNTELHILMDNAMKSLII